MVNNKIRLVTRHRRAPVGNHSKPIELWSDKVVNQKIHYIHMNPVVAGFVTSPEHWKYSSAKNYNGLADSQIEIDI